MADAAPQKRVLPRRERRESAAKRRASSPLAPPTKGATPKRPTPSKTPKTASASRSQRKKEPEPTPPPPKSVTPAVEEILPSRILDNHALPTTRSKQASNLSIKEYQSIAESAVLAASMHQSRTKWLVDEMFTKYWTKPSKKKGAPEVQNPDTKSMVKLGSCTMVIEPHTFEVMMFTVRDPNAQNVQYRPPVHYPPPHPAYQPQPGYASSPMSGLQVQARPPYTAQAPYIKQDPGRNYSTPMASPARHPPSNPQSTPMTAASSAGSRPPSSFPPKPGSGPNSESEKNPVIQKLATAAASDPDLKALMQVVASSRATPEQLRTFQRHLDRLNAQIARENAEAQRNKATSVPQSPAQNGAAPIPRQGSTQLNANPTPHHISNPPSATPTKNPNTAPMPPTPIKKEPDAPTGPTSNAPQATAQTNSKPVQTPTGTPASQPGAPTPMMTPQPRPQQPKNTPIASPMYGAPYASYPPPPPQPLVKHIVFENLTPISAVQTSNPDRYLFPEYAVLDFSPDPRGTVILASFFVIRKGKQILESSTTGGSLGREGTFYNAEEEYYQPVTMRLIANNPKVLETIARAAKPLKVVQEWMENVIKTKKRAEDCYLPLRLPRESDGQDGVLGETEGNVGSKADRAKMAEEMPGPLTSHVDVDDELREVYEQPDSLVPLAWKPMSQWNTSH